MSKFFIDISGQKFGKLTAENPVEKPKGKAGTGVYWSCKCDCGGTRIVKGNYLRRMEVTDCGCVLIQKRLDNKKFLAGQRFGKLTCLYELDERKNNYITWHCHCDCGNDKDVSQGNLINGTTKSCGCLKTERESLLGNTYNKLLVVECAEMTLNYTKWKCLCYCGNYVTVIGSSLKNGNTKSCGCYFYKVTEENASNLIGQKFGRLSVIELVKIYNGNNKSERHYKCLCDCGNYTTVRGTSLTFDQTQSCGCLQKETVSEASRKQFGEAAFNKAYGYYRNGAFARELEFLLTKEEVKDIMNKNCYYCGEPPDKISKNKYNNGDYLHNGIDRIDSSKGYFIENCVPCCKKCNIAKLAMKREEFFDWIEKVFYYSIYKKEKVD
jgi:hypothetical protein